MRQTQPAGPHYTFWSRLSDMLKQIAKFAVHHTGAIHLVQRLNREAVRILMYHRFPKEHRQNFDRQCAFLASRYNVVPLAEAVRRLTRKESLANLAVITVDDGYADMYEVAFPILKKYKLPATLFVTTGFVNRTCWMPGDRVRFHFAHSAEPKLEVQDDGGNLHVFARGGKSGSDGLRSLLKRVSNRTRSRILAGLEGGEAPPEAAWQDDLYRPCTWDQLREMAGAGISIGAHTVTHPMLSRLESQEETEFEILGSQACLERELHRSVDTFAYPNGTSEDIDGASVDCVRAHFAAAVTAVAGLNTAGAKPHELLRLPSDPDIPVPQLARLMAGPLRPVSAVVPTHVPGRTAGVRVT